MSRPAKHSDPVVDNKSAIFAACASGDTAALEDCPLDWPELAKLKNKENETLLIIAAQHGHVELTDKLLQATPSAARNHKDSNDRTALMHAIESQNYKIALTLAKSGLRNLPCLYTPSLNDTPLHLICQQARLDTLGDDQLKDMVAIVKLLCQDKEGLNLRNSLGETALHAALQAPPNRQQIELASQLFAAGIELSFVSEDSGKSGQQLVNDLPFTIQTQLFPERTLSLEDRETERRASPVLINPEPREDCAPSLYSPRFTVSMSRAERFRYTLFGSLAAQENYTLGDTGYRLPDTDFAHLALYEKLCKRSGRLHDHDPYKGNAVVPRCLPKAYEIRQKGIKP
jgi:ankyrin repeat protein